MSKPRTILTPATETSDFSKETPLTFWKQILPEKTINYTSSNGKTRKLEFNREYLTDLANAWKNKSAVDQTSFLLADKDNSHTMDPERFRAEVDDMRLAEPGENPGLYARLKFATKEAAAAVISNPSLGVSARIRENITKSDGTFVKRGIIHILGTLDPQVTGMSAWQPVDLSAYGAIDLDLSHEQYEEGSDDMAGTVAIKDRALDSFSIEEIDKFTEAELEEFSEAFLSDEVESPEEESDDEDDASEDEEESIVTKTPEAVSLSKQAQKDIDLANSAAAVANARATEALRRAAAAEFKEFRTAALLDGVPPHVLDLAEPVLNRPDSLVIDLSNSDDDDLDVTEIVRKLVDGYKGSIDLSNESGHNGSFNAGDGEDPDAALLAQWENGQY